MDKKKNEVFTVKIEDLGESGEGIGKTDGYIWFIKDTVIGDVVEAKVMKIKKSYGYARLEKILIASEARVSPPCPVARKCGGCQLQAMSYKEQLRFKERKIYNNLTRIGGLDQVPMEPIIGMDHPWHYRNKAQFPWGVNKEGKIITGFYAGGSHTIIENENCLIGIQQNQRILEKIRSYMEQFKVQPYDEIMHKGLVRHTLIRAGFKTGEIMVCLILNGNKLPHSEELVKSLLEVEGMTSISINVNREKTNVIMGKKIENLYGSGYITDYIGDIRYRISPLSFYQVNPVQTENLYKTALEFAGITGGDTVWDLYCGIGTISLFLAQKAKKVYGIEIIPEAICDARENAKLNGINNVEFFVGKAEEVLPEQYEKRHIHADVVVVDPPRKGCDKICLDTIIKMEPKRMVYISCDSATLARDIKYLTERGFTVQKVRGCDMFPQSGHVEVVIMMTYRGSDKKNRV